jgi:hypothetical protein
MGTFARGAIAFDPPPHGVGAAEPDENALKLRDRTLNRQVFVKLSPRGAPIPPVIDPKTELDSRLRRCVDITDEAQHA